MTSSSDADSPWRELLEHRSVDVIAGHVASGVRFLETARRPDAGWGSFVGADTDRHSSALAMQALRLANSDDAQWMVKDGTAYFFELYRKQIRGLGAEALIDVTSLLGDRLQHDAALTSVVVRRGREILDSLLGDVSLPLTTLSRLLLVGCRRETLSPDQIQRGCQALWDYRNDEGTWGATPRAAASLLPTATAARALARCDDGGRHRDLEPAYRYLETELVSRTSDGGPPDPYVCAMALRALGECPSTPYSVLAVIIDYLLALQREDGGWSSTADTPSTVDHTAMVVIALISSGELRLVPWRLAWEATSSLEEAVRRTQDQHRTSKETVLEAVRREVPALVAANERFEKERDEALQIADKTRALELENLRLRRVAAPSLYSTRILTSDRLGVRTLTLALVAGISAVLLAMVLVLSLTESLVLAKDVKIVLASVAMVAVIGVLTATLALGRQNRRILADLDDVTARSVDSEYAELKGSSGQRALARLRAVFIDISEQWPPDVREEVLFALHERLADVPISIAGRVATDIMKRLGVVVPERQLEFAEWLEAVALLRPIDRQVLFDLLRQRSVD